mmetsp:Transcript_52598/g.145465  ORF Transcript_52598/g.145465 Transcript_52598/m.145465 type:complete len:250 (+) Transcript_52598:409-1158(+)
MRDARSAPRRPLLWPVLLAPFKLRAPGDCPFGPSMRCTSAIARPLNAHRARRVRLADSQPHSFEHGSLDARPLGGDSSLAAATCAICCRRARPVGRECEQLKSVDSPDREEWPLGQLSRRHCARRRLQAARRRPRCGQPRRLDGGESVRDDVEIADALDRVVALERRGHSARGGRRAFAAHDRRLPARCVHAAAAAAEGHVDARAADRALEAGEGIDAPEFRSRRRLGDGRDAVGRLQRLDGAFHHKSW